MISPVVFIPIAERFGLIRSIGEWVIEDACRQAGVWRKKGLKMRVAINLSAVQMRQEDIVERIEGALARHHVDPSLLTCEITESVAMEDTKATQTTFRELGAAGIHLAIDDFGTGYSSLAYLHKLPAEELKIDRSFVADIEYSADARAVVNAVVKLAHALGLKVVAEGVENERQQRILVEDGLRRAAGLPVRQADDRTRAAAVGAGRSQGARREFCHLAVRRDARARHPERQRARARLRTDGLHAARGRRRRQPVVAAVRRPRFARRALSALTTSTRSMPPALARAT